ncbi:MAG: hypothetical protein KDI55_13255 [Anaerolineae bacterium]|nr:hypothetical protein [Anaerolineae bacterium]
MTTGTGRRSRRSVDSAIAPDTPPRKRVAPIYLLVLLLLSLFAWAPLLYPGFFQLHSGFQSLFNLADLAEAKEFIRWAPPLASGGGLFQSEGPLAYWLALLIQPLLGDIGGLKAVLALSMVLGGAGMFWWTRGIAGADVDSSPEIAARAGLLAGVVYMLWPPLLVNTYVEGGFGTALFLGLLPWAFAGITSTRLQLDYTAHQEDDRGEFSPLPRILFVVLIATLLVFADPTLGLLALPFLIIWTLWPPVTWAARLTATVAVLVGGIWAIDLIWLFGAGAGVKTFFSPPDIEHFLSHSIHPYQLLSPVWGFGTSTSDWKDDISFQLGLVALGLAVLTVAFAISARRRAVPATDDPDAMPARPRSWYAILYAAIFGLILVFMATTLARPLWRLLPKLAGPLIYPWELLGLVGPLLALLAGLVVQVERRLAVLPVWAAIVALVVLGSYNYLAPRTTQIEPDLAVAAGFGDGKVSLLRADITPLTPSPSPLRGEESSDLPRPEGEGRGEGEIVAGNALTLTVVWQPLQPLDFDYNLFIHGFDGEGNRIAQWDGQPQRDGEADPMTTWSVGEIVSGDYVLTTEDDRPISDVATLWLGLYNWQTGERLPVNGDDKVILSLLPIPAAETGP